VAKWLIARQNRHVVAPYIGSELGELECGEERQPAIRKGDIDQDPDHGVRRGRTGAAEAKHRRPEFCCYVAAVSSWKSFL